MVRDMLIGLGSLIVIYNILGLDNNLSRMRANLIVYSW